MSPMGTNPRRNHRWTLTHRRKVSRAIHRVRVFLPGRSSLDARLVEIFIEEDFAVTRGNYQHLACSISPRSQNLNLAVLVVKSSLARKRANKALDINAHLCGVFW